MSNMFNPQFRNLSSSINGPNYSNGMANGVPSTSGTHHHMHSPPFTTDPLSKSWCVNATKLEASFDGRPSWPFGSANHLHHHHYPHSALNQSMDSLSNSHHMYDSSPRIIKNEYPPTPMMETPISNGLPVSNIKPPSMVTPIDTTKPMTNRHEWPTLPPQQTHPSFNSRSSIANFRGFTSCDETTLRRQLQAAGSFGGSFNDNHNLHNSHNQHHQHQMTMYGSNATTTNYPFVGGTNQNNGQQHLSQTIGSVVVSSGSSGDCINNDEMLPLTNGLVTSNDNQSRFMLSQSHSMNEITTATTTSIATTANNGTTNGNDFDNFIQELCQK